MAKAAYWTVTDTEARKRGEQTGLDTLVAVSYTHLVSIQAKIIRTLMDLQKKLGMSYLFITHDMSLMRNIADRIAIMYLGRIMEMAPAQAFFENPQHPYTKMLVSSIPVVLEEEEKLKPDRVESRGEIPSPVDIPPGCRFHGRCPYAEETCRREEPPMREVLPDHYAACHLAGGKNETKGRI